MMPEVNVQITYLRKIDYLRIMKCQMVQSYDPSFSYQTKLSVERDSMKGQKVLFLQ